MRHFLKTPLTFAGLIALSLPAMAAVKVPVYQVISPSTSVAGLKTISVSITGDQADALNADIIAAIQNKDQGKLRKLGALSDLVEGAKIDVGKIAGDAAAHAGLDTKVGGVDVANLAEKANLEIDLGKFAGIRDLPAYEVPVDILTLKVVESGGDIHITGTATGEIEVVSTDATVQQGDKQVPVKCMHKTGKIVFDVQVQSTAGAAIGLLVDTVEIDADAVKVCSNSKEEAEAILIDDDTLFSFMRRDPVDTLTAMVKPRWSKAVYKLEKDKTIAAAVKSIQKRDDVQKSIQQISEAYKANPYNYPAAFSVAVLMEMQGDLENAKRQYQIAGKLKQTALQGEALLRLQARTREADRLKAIGINIRKQ